jgi:HD-like signal output (HDOD) protein/ActR/RegA family two-component response regulator
MKRILFVEDNELLRMLYGMLLANEREQWETSVAPDGQSALKLLAEKPFDVVVSDMDMPGMDGIQLLTEVRRMHPQTSRIIMSGMTDQGVAANSLNCTHLFIPKPLDLKGLKATLSRIGSLDEFLRDERLRGLAGRMRALPSFPALYLEILREVESPTSSIQGMAKIIAQDPGMTAKLLQLVNSAAFGLAEPSSDPVEAVQQLGANTVRSLVLSAQVYSQLAPGRVKSFSAEALWLHLMKCGELARAILRLEGAESGEVEEAFTAGMLHDMGKLMLADSLPDEFGQALELAKEEDIPLPEAEARVLGATHAGLAAYLFGLWGLPAAIVEAVAFHHTPERSDLKRLSALTAVHAANAMTDESGKAALNMEYLAAVGAANRVEAWRKLAAESRMG